MTAASGGLVGLVLFVLGGCGLFGVGEEPSGGWSQFAEPPPIVMTSAAGRQEAAALGGCFREANGVRCMSGIGISPTDGSVVNEVSVVRPGERVAITVAGAGPTQRLLVIRPLGCSTRLVASVILEPADTAWRVDLPPGAYEIGVGVASFTTKDARGSLEGALGVLVDRSRPLAIVPAAEHAQVCLEESTR